MSTLCRTIRSMLVQWRFELWLHSPFWHSHTNLISHRLWFLSLHCWRSWRFRWIGCYLWRRRIAGSLQRFSRLRLLMDFTWLLLRAVFYFPVFPFIDVSFFILALDWSSLSSRLASSKTVSVSSWVLISPFSPTTQSCTWLCTFRLRTFRLRSSLKLWSSWLVRIGSSSWNVLLRLLWWRLGLRNLSRLSLQHTVIGVSLKLELFPVDGLESYGCGYVFFLRIDLLDTGLTFVI